MRFMMATQSETKYKKGQKPPERLKRLPYGNLLFLFISVNNSFSFRSV